MGARGRKSAASLEVATTSEVERVTRPDAPYDLTDEQAEEWWAVVNAEQPDHFPRSTHGLLALYCRHLVASRKIAQLITDCETRGTASDGTALLDLDRYDQLLRMQEREGRAASSLATRLRITQQATVSPKMKKPPMVRKPWEA